ncbi:hypothetical protein EMMF5_000179 [Cystobasidiomycetes sp. EMM_F5]
MTAGWIIATAVVGTLCVVGFVGIWIWFPRTFARGFKEEMKAVDEELAAKGASPEEVAQARAARNAMSKGIVERAIAREQALKRGERPSDEAVVPREYYERNPHLGFTALPVVSEASERHATNAPPNYKPTEASAPPQY